MLGSKAFVRMKQGSVIYDALITGLWANGELSSFVANPGTPQRFDVLNSREWELYDSPVHFISSPYNN